jgi:peptidoglycan/xylan/chitin deacetylase (PgdA/CDA1 family)
MYFVRPPFLLKKIYQNCIWSVPTTEKVLYLTFDDGPIPEVTPWVLEQLKKYQARATFFCIGENVKKHPEIYKMVQAAGHTIGNHTYNHRNGWKVSDEHYIKNIGKCSKFVDSKLFRPPYGKIKHSQYKVVQDNYSIIMWNVLSGDFDPDTSPRECLENSVKYTEKGSIIVFHDSLKASVNLYHVLPVFLRYFSQRGYRFEALPALS